MYCVRFCELRCHIDVINGIIRLIHLGRRKYARPAAGVCVYVHLYIQYISIGVR